MAHPNRHPPIIKQLPNVVGVHSIHHEGDRTTSIEVVLRSDDAHPGHFFQAAERIAGERMFVLSDARHTHVLEVTHRSA